MERKAYAANTLKGRKEVSLDSQCIFTHFSSAFPFPLLNLPLRYEGVLTATCPLLQSADQTVSCIPCKLVPALPYRDSTLPFDQIHTSLPFLQVEPPHGSTNKNRLFSLLLKSRNGACVLVGTPPKRR